MQQTNGYGRIRISHVTHMNESCHAGAEVNATNKWLWTPLHVAAAEGHIEVAV